MIIVGQPQLIVFQCGCA